MVFDKTGTLTKGEFKVTGIYPSGDADQETIEKRQDTDKADGWSGFPAGSVRTGSPGRKLLPNHPVSRSIREAWGHSFEHTRIADAEEIPGHGIRVKADGRTVLAGNDRLMKMEILPISHVRAWERWFIWQRKETFWVPFLFPM